MTPRSTGYGTKHWSGSRRVDIVMNNVGVLTSGLPEHIPLTEWQRIIDVNLLSVVRSNAVFIPHLLDQGSGHIVNSASFAGLSTYSYDRMPYAATKAAIVQITEGLAIYLRPEKHRRHVAVPRSGADQHRHDVPQFGTPTRLRTPGEQFTLLDPAPVGELVAEAIVHNRFFVPTHPNVLDALRDRLHDWDAFIDFQISREPPEKGTP